MSVEAWIALGSLALLCLAQFGGVMIWGGNLTQRVRTLESVNAQRADLKPELASMAATLIAQGDRINELKKDTHEAFAELNHVIRNRVMTQQPRG